MTDLIQSKQKNKGLKMIEYFFLAILILYPMRHVNMGGDLWDVGYNYGNFTFFNQESIGKTWFFSTYLASAVGHFLTLLPFGRTFIGLTVYVSLTLSLLATMGYLFCTRVLRFSPWLTFAGEFLAVNMSWCPTAVLYNYLTYIFFLAGIMLLYMGLVKGKKWMLMVAGACLALNVFVRFSDLPEMGLIVAVWGFAIFESRERCEGKKWLEPALGKMLRDTAWCILGYAGMLLLMFAWFAVRYGISNYVTGIRLLFSMTENATEYKPIAMVKSMLYPFKDAIYWIRSLCFFAVMALLAAFVGDNAPGMFSESTREKLKKPFSMLGMAGAVLACVCMTFWIFYQGKGGGHLTSFFYTSYDSIYWPCSLLWMYAMGICVIEIVRPRNAKENKLCAMLLFMVSILTPLGSNNGIYPIFNNLYVLAPYTFMKTAEFTKYVLTVKKRQSGRRFRFNALPVCLAIWTFLMMVFVQTSLFGWNFVFCESTGMQKADGKIVHSRVLCGVRMKKERAVSLEDLCSYAEKNRFSEQEVILHGDIPALSFYLGMRPAFHSWNDLLSFDYFVMRDTMENLMEQIDKQGRRKPVVIAEKGYAPYGPVSSKEATNTAVIDNKDEDEKWELIRKFMGKYGYQKTFENEKFVVWQAP